MPIENDFTRVFGAIKELEARVQSLEVRSRLDKWNVFVEQEVTPIPTSGWPKTTKPAEHVADFLESASDERHIAHLKLVGGVARSATEGVMTLIDENNQLRFILSILAAVKDDGWIEWHGGECPVDPDVIVDIKTRASGRPNDIIAYRIAR